MEILDHTLCICLLRLPLWGNTSPHSLQQKKYLQYVLPIVSSDSFPMQILHHTLCICLFRWLPYGNLFFGMCCHRCLQITSLCKSCTSLFAAKWLFFIMYTCIWGKYWPTLLARFVLPYMCLQITSLCKSCTTLFAYVSLYDHFREILPHTPWAKKYVLLLFRWLLYVNPAPHSMHMSLKMTTSGKYCPALLAQKKSPV